MKILNREEVKRIVGQQPVAAGGGGGGDFDPTVLNGYATELWVDENYISIEFFSRLFQAHGTENGVQTDIDPNDMDSTITSIESMFGFWTDYYLSALGNGGGLGSTLYLSTLADVLISSPANNQVLTYNASTGKWVNANPQAGVTDLASLTDVTLTTPSANQVLMYNGTNWVNSDGVFQVKVNNQLYSPSNGIVDLGTIGSGGGGGTGYLPLTGGTMVGSIYFNNAGSIGANGSYARLVATNDHIGGLVLQLGTTPSSGYNRFEIINQAWSKSLFYVNNSGVASFGGTEITDSSLSIIGTCLRVCQSSSNNTWPLAVGKAAYGLLLGVDTNGNPTLGTYGNIGGTYIRLGGKLGIDNGIELYNTSDNYPYIDFHHNNDNTVDFTSRIIEMSRGTLTFYSSVIINNNLGVGTSPSYKLHVSGDIYAMGAVTALSDIRKKDVLSTDVGLTVEQIADAPTIKFLWKDKRNEGIQVGSVAQFWAANLPEVVMDKGGELSMQYGVAALVSAIITARKVVDHERRISELERENERLKTEVEQLRLN